MNESYPVSVGDGGMRTGPGVQPWVARMDDPDEPLFTIAVACDLLGSDAQSIRRLDRLGITSSTRTPGNQRRYSRNDVVRLGEALRLRAEGVPQAAIVRVLAAEARLAPATGPAAPPPAGSRNRGARRRASGG